MTEEEQKEFRGQLRNAWMQTSLERDKSILTLSFGAIGLLFVIVDKLPISNHATLLIFLLAILSFMIAVVSVVWIFQENRPILQSQLKGEDENSKFADLLDHLAVGGFCLGLLLSCILAFLYAMHSYDINTQEKREQNMSEEIQPQKPITESFKGVNRIKPGDGEILTNSYKKISEIAPVTPTPTKPAVESKDANKSG
jgi:hypothetical protein